MVGVEGGAKGLDLLECVYSKTSITTFIDVSSRSKTSISAVIIE